MVPTPKNRKVSAGSRQRSGSCCNSKEQPKTSTASVSHAGLLNRKLDPIIYNAHPQLKETGKIEREFFNSLRHLSEFYGLEITSHKDFPFPMNILTALEEAAIGLLDKNEHLRLAIIQDEKHIATLATASPFDTKTTLYYIPCEPLYEFLEDSRRKSLADLCLSIFTYLFQVVEIPHHRQWSSYLSHMYDMLEQWMNEDDEPEDHEYREAELKELDENAGKGDYVLQLMGDRNHLQSFEQRVADFKPSDEIEATFLETAGKALHLYLDFPERSVMQGIHPELIPEDDYSNGRVHADKYMSFLWSFNDSVYDALEDSINCDLQECSDIDQPFALQLFDKLPVAETHDFDFETRLFDMIDHLVCNLRDLQFNEPMSNRASA